MPGPSGICDLHHSSWQCQMLHLWSKAKDGTHVLMVTSQVHYPWATVERPLIFWSLKWECAAWLSQRIVFEKQWIFVRKGKKHRQQIQTQSFKLCRCWSRCKQFICFNNKWQSRFFNHKRKTNKVFNTVVQQISCTDEFWIAFVAKGKKDWICHASKNFKSNYRSLFEAFKSVEKHLWWSI